MHELALQRMSRLGDDPFVDAPGETYEHSPWVTERAWSSRPFSSVDKLWLVMKRAVEDVSCEKQLQLLRAYPDLGERTEMTDASEARQASVELDSLSRSQYETLQRLNEMYRERFGSPSAMTVKDKNPDATAATMEHQVDHSELTEFRTVLDEVHTIAELWLTKRFSSE